MNWLAIGLVMLGIVGVGIVVFLFKKYVDHIKQSNSSFWDEQKQNLIQELMRLNEQNTIHWKSLSDVQQKYLEGILNTINTLTSRIDKQLERIRSTVDEKLTETLNKRLAQQFNLVSDRLEKVYKQLGEMQELNKGVGDLKRILSGVKTRGVWGEMQLEEILANFFSPVQYVKNARLFENAREVVEFAIKIPQDISSNKVVYLPLDSKFPIDVYSKLVKAAQTYDKEAIKQAEKEFFKAIKAEAKRISKYVNPPITTNFAIMYIPSEGMYAQIAKSPEFMSALYKEYRIMVAGPATITAFLTSISMGLRTFAIQKHTDRVWELLKHIRKDFEKFQVLLAKTSKNLELTKRQIDEALKRTDKIAGHLESVEQLPAPTRE